MEPEVSLSFSQESPTETYPEPDKSCPHFSYALFMSVLILGCPPIYDYILSFVPVSSSLCVPCTIPSHPPCMISSVIVSMVKSAS